MKHFKEKLSVVAVILLLVSVLLIHASGAEVTNKTNPFGKDKLLVFLSNVIGLDLAKYNVTVSSGVTYPYNFGGLVKQEVISCQLDYNGRKIGIMGIFYNEYIFAIDILPNQGPLIYAQPPSANPVDEAKSILRKYQIFANDYGITTSHLTTALNMLNNVNELTSSSTILGNTKLEVSRITYNEANFNRTLISFKWIYTANGVDAYNKRLEITFEDNATYFKDTWGFFTIGCFSVISEAEAVEIAFAAAKSYNLTLVGEDGVLIPAQPDWSGMTYTIALNMIPGQIYNRDPNDHFVNPGSAVRDPLALYPLWESVFYFGKNIGQTVGIAVGVWGDTKEIAYITPYGYLGDMGGNQTAPVATSPSAEPSVAPSETPVEPENNSLSSAYLLLGLCITVAVVTAAAIALRKRSR
ncbi:MAG: hypothetical protein WHU54_01575 [Candidatus Bathyarchaeia archaeon]|jgi:hypothetical protein